MKKFAWVWLCLSLGLSLGCSEEWGPSKFPSSRVTGRVMSGGAPLEQGWIELIPTEGTPGLLRSSPLGKDGVFVVKDAAVGRVSVRVVNPPRGAGVRRDVAASFASFVRLDVLPDRENRVEIDVMTGKVEVLPSLSEKK